MSDIELVIKISEELYEAYKGRPPMLGDAGMDMIAQSIAKGTPLPKGHGRLKDIDKFPVNEIERMEYNYECGENECYSEEIVYLDDIINADTIIEADTDEEKSIDTIVKNGFHNTHKADKEM